MLFGAETGVMFWGGAAWAVVAGKAEGAWGCDDWPRVAGTVVWGYGEGAEKLLLGWGPAAEKRRAHS